MGRLENDVLFKQAVKAFAANDTVRAKYLCEQVLLRERYHAPAMIMLGQIAFADNLLDEAESHLLKAAALRPRDLRIHVILGEIHTFQGRYDDAVARYEKALRRDPNHPHAMAGKADAYEKSGQRDKARALLAPHVESGRESPQLAIVQARLDSHDRDYQAVIDRVTRHIESGDTKGYVLWHLCFLLGRALERTERFDEAFAAYERGNAAVPAHFDGDSWRAAIDEIIRSFSPDRFARVPRASHGGELPVFVIGMPRSGSTLVETILSAHPVVAAAGEFTAMQHIINAIPIDIGSDLPYPACIEDLELEDVDSIAGNYLQRLRQVDRKAERIADKYLNNYLHVGMLAVLFPQARIVHCRRHPLDTCLSCYQVPLMPATHPWASDLRDIGTMYVSYERLMAHWRDVLKIPMLEVAYEAMVAQQEEMTRRIIDFCGLDWDDACLRFHEQKRVVQTASYDQVTQPVYSSSVGRYKGFEQHLGPLKEVLAEGGWTQEALQGVPATD
jgi:tetratricopeptide (TPR) repeat protein